MPKQHVDKEAEAEHLRMVRKVIEEILRDANICGQVILGGREGRFESFSALDANWCCLKREELAPGREGLRLKSLASAYGFDRERQKQEQEWSLSVVSGFGSLGGEVAISWLECADFFFNKTGATHTPVERDDPRDKPEGGEA